MTLKRYITYPAIELPHVWARVVNPRDFHGQGRVLVCARTKAAAVKELMWLGLHDIEAARIMRSTRVVDQPDNEIAAILASGIVDDTKPGVYAWRSSFSGMPIARITLEQPTVVATFHRTSDHSATLTVQPNRTENRTT